MLICEECGEPCESVEDTFDFSGTHCTNGNGGTHRTGEYSSSCCGADYLEGRAGCSTAVAVYLHYHVSQTKYFDAKNLALWHAGQKEYNERIGHE